jgi:hypothetical protein
MQGQILLLDLFIRYIVVLSFFVVKPIKPINMKSNVCNSLNCSAQYILEPIPVIEQWNTNQCFRYH